MAQFWFNIRTTCNYEGNKSNHLMSMVIKSRAFWFSHSVRGAPASNPRHLIRSLTSLTSAFYKNTNIPLIQQYWFQFITARFGLTYRGAHIKMTSTLRTSQQLLPVATFTVCTSKFQPVGGAQSGLKWTGEDRPACPPAPLPQLHHTTCPLAAI